MMEKLREVHRRSGHEGGSPETQKLDRETFRRLEKLVAATLSFYLCFLNLSHT
jgi:hypothetical protein